MKTPSFKELQTLVEYYTDELLGAQLQEIQASEMGLVLVFYRFVKEPKTAYLVFDLDIPFPFVGLYFENPWPHLKKTKPVGLFLNSHAKNSALAGINLIEKYGRVVQIDLGREDNRTQIEYRMIPKQANLLVSKEMKSISWYPPKELQEQVQTSEMSGLSSEEEEIRSVHFILNSWLQRRSATTKKSLQGAPSGQNPYEKWKAQKQKDISKKRKALDGIQKQIDEFLNTPWNEIGEHLKNYGKVDLKPEWHQYLDFEQSVSQNMQNCFAKAKAAKAKISGAQARLGIIQNEINELSDLSEQAFQKHLHKLNQRQQQAKSQRVVEGRYRKLFIESSGLTCYMGKSAKDNLDLLRKAKAWDYWVHLKDYPSAYAIIHRQKSQNVSNHDIAKVAEWLVKESFKEKKSSQGVKFAVVYVECRHVRPIKGDKLGRVTYHEAREILIAL